MPVDFGAAPAYLARLDGDEKHEPSAFSTFTVLHVLYERVLRIDPADPPIARPRPVPALEGPRAAGVLRDARGRRVLPRGVARRLRRRSTRRSATTRTAPGAGRRDLVRLARPRPAAGRRRGARAARAGADGAARLLPDRRRRAGRGLNHEAIAFAGRVGARRADGVASTTRPPRTAGRAASRARFAGEGWSTRDGRRPRPRRARARARGRPPRPAARGRRRGAGRDRHAGALRRRRRATLLDDRSARRRRARRHRRRTGSRPPPPRIPTGSSTSASASS